MSSEPTAAATYLDRAPVTEGGRELSAHPRSDTPAGRELLTADICRIEAEAVAAYRADLEAKVRALPTYGYMTRPGDEPSDETVILSRAAVLRLLTDGAEPPKPEGERP